MSPSCADRGPTATVLRRISWLIALGLGCAALAWGLFLLHGIFVEERDEALAEVAGRRRALEQYAHKELEQRLAAQLAEARAGIEAAASDPLLPASRVLLFDRGRQLLPRTARPRKDDSGAAGLYRDLARRPEALAEAAEDDEPEAPFSERLRLFIAFREALAAGDKAAIEARFRAILSHRAAYVIATTSDVPLMLAALDALAERAEPQSQLMSIMLRDGLSGPPARFEGLERVILRHLERFSAEELRFLAGRIAALAEPHKVLYSDFESRIDEAITRAEAPGEALVVPADLAGPALLYDGRWYAEPGPDGRVHGVMVAVDRLLEEITVAMRERALIAPGDEVVAHLGAPTAALSDLALEVDSASWPRIELLALERYRLKTGLEGLIALLVFGVMALGSVVYRRRHRFLELKGDFVSAVSHELRTPLASIRLMAETLERRTKDLPKAKDYPARIIRDVDGLSFLVENILSFNRLSRGRWTAKPEAVALESMVEKLERDRDSWAKKPAVLRAEGIEKVVIDADPDLLQLLLTNLARNAVQYSERSPARITLAAAADERGWLLSVGDNGVGIPPGEEERIFDDFYRSAAGKTERGSGLGLAICRKIMEAHGGSIRVAETGSEGTTFELRFPRTAS